jgi:hypothetical protein
MKSGHFDQTRDAFREHREELDLNLSELEILLAVEMYDRDGLAYLLTPTLHRLYLLEEAHVIDFAFGEANEESVISIGEGKYLVVTPI